MRRVLLYGYLLATCVVTARSSAAQTGDACPDYVPPPFAFSGAPLSSATCGELRAQGEAICRYDYLDVIDGQMETASDGSIPQLCYLKKDIEAWQTWSHGDRAVTIVIYFHGGLVDANTGLENAASLDPTLRDEDNGIFPFYVIYHVGAIESVNNGRAQRGLFQIQTSRDTGLANRYVNYLALNAARAADDRTHHPMTRREDWMRDGWPLPSEVGDYGSLAWAYMKQSIYDGLDMTDDQLRSPPVPADTPQPAPVDSAELLDTGTCLHPTAQEIDPWPHLRPGTYNWQLAGTRDFLCRLGKLVEQRGRARLKTNIVLIGHSTGAIYITDFIRKAQQLWYCSTGCGSALSAQKFDVIFLAPAVSYQDFDRMLGEASVRLRNFRVFTMDDKHERMDRVLASTLAPFGKTFQTLVRYYDHSLLYLVSGLFEVEPDAPLIGLDRFHSDALLKQMKDNATTQAERDDYSEIEYADTFFQNRYGGWDKVFALSPSLANAPVTFRTQALDHGFFPADPETRASMRALLEDTATNVPWPTPDQSATARAP